MALQETQIPFDEEKADAFADRLIGALNDGALCLMTSIGHRTGLFDAMRELPPATSQQIADEAGLQERYVREWLGAMSTAGIVAVDPEGPRFSLPPEHAAFLTRTAPEDNVALFTQYIAVLGRVEDDIVQCFKNGGGVPYERFPRFHDVMEEDSVQSVLSGFDEHILPLVPGLDDRLEHGIRVLDVGCGRGRALNWLAERYPNSRFVGLDLSEDAIAHARATARACGNQNLEFTTADAATLHQTARPDEYDLVTTFDAIHDQARPLDALKGIHKVLKPDGVYLMQDISGTSHIHKDLDHPIGTLLYTLSCMHCMTVSLAQGGEGLGAMWGEETTREYLQNAGFERIETRRLEHDFQNNWYVIRK